MEMAHTPTQLDDFTIQPSAATSPLLSPDAHLEHTRTIRLNPDQEEAVTALLDYIQDPGYGNDWYFTFSGYAGTGKTFCMREVVSRCASSRSRFAYTAPTNKAAKVLRSVTGSACTIYSLLGLRIDKSGELKQLVTGKSPDLSDLDVVFIDEGSMVNSNLFGHLRDAADKWGFKVVFMGDAAQLPPVGETHSPIWAGDIGANLTRVMRHDNQILTLVTEIRNVMNSIAPSINIKSNHDERGGVWKQSKMEFRQSIYDAAANGDFADGSTAKVVAWRNVRVAEYNNIIRAAIFGAEAIPGTYLPGDRIVAAGPCERGDEVLLTTDDEAIVESVALCKHPLEPKYQAVELKCRTELNKVIRLLVLHPSSQQQFDNDSQNLAHDARGNGKLWKKFWEHQDLFHQIKYGYALTAHRAQGSTYTKVWVDYQDILYNRNRKEAFQCLYVACSRPTTELRLA
jgi:ATP-dependent exoDNAse (exonuclease V) alpha subunit